MDLWLAAYYVGGIIAVILCWNLGAIFYVPMLLNLGLEIALGAGLAQEFDIRQVVAVTGFLHALWVIVLSDVFKNWIEGATVFVLISLAFVLGIYPSVVESTNDWSRSIELATLIIRTWMLVIVGVVLIVFFRSIITSRWRWALSAMVVNPKRRFLIPIGLWALIILIPLSLTSRLGAWLEENRFHLAGITLVWGWVAIEVKFFLQSLKT